MRKVRGLAFAAKSPVTNLAKLTGSLHEQGAFESLSRFVYNTSCSFNGFDKFGHFLRTNILVSSCIEYQPHPFGGCVANFTGPGTAFPSARNAFSRESVARAFGLRHGADSGGTVAPLGAGEIPDFGGFFGAPAASSTAKPDPTTPDGGVGVLDYLLGP